MNRENIIRMAQEAGLDPDLWNYTDAFERFAALVASAERNEIIQILEDSTGYVQMDLIRERGQA